MSSINEHIISISPSLNERLNRLDLLKPEGSLCISFKYGWSDDFIFKVSAPNYDLIFELTSEYFILQRNFDIVQLALPDESNAGELIVVSVSWSPNRLRLYVTDNQGNRFEEIATRNTFPPNLLFEWARKESLLPKSSDENPSALYLATVEQFKILAEKIIDTNAINGFWDITYNGNKIQSRTPKRETEIHPQIRLQLYDLEILRGLNVNPEYPAGSGNMDFLITGSTDSGEIIKICVEFKLAHSEDIARGLEIQLPEYMERCKTDYGIYAVLYFGDDYPAKIDRFKIPNFDTRGRSLDFVLPIATLNIGKPYITSILFNLGKRVPPSKD